MFFQIPCSAPSPAPELIMPQVWEHNFYFIKNHKEMPNCNGYVCFIILSYYVFMWRKMIYKKTCWIHLSWPLKAKTGVHNHDTIPKYVQYSLILSIEKAYRSCTTNGQNCLVQKGIPGLQRQRLIQQFCYSETWLEWFPAIALNVVGTKYEK
jgi:hypothetical protein